MGTSFGGGERGRSQGERAPRRRCHVTAECPESEPVGREGPRGTVQAEGQWEVMQGDSGGLRGSGAIPSSDRRAGDEAGMRAGRARGRGFIPDLRRRGRPLKN